METNDAVLACLQLMGQNGAKVIAKYTGDYDEIRNAFDEMWVLEHHESLSMLTLALPPHGCFSLLHPSIEFWELERSDIVPLEESE